MVRFLELFPGVFRAGVGGAVHGLGRESEAGVAESWKQNSLLELSV